MAKSQDLPDPPGHYCPGCGAALKAFPRYPWHFCLDCCKSATDGDGRALSLSGGMGFMWRYRDAGTEEWVTCSGIRALIRGRPVYITEARFGGVVAQPLLAGHHDLSPERVIDLTRPKR